MTVWFILLFLVCQLVNVILSTIKSVVTIKGTKLLQVFSVQSIMVSTRL